MLGRRKGSDDDQLQLKPKPNGSDLVSDTSVALKFYGVYLLWSSFKSVVITSLPVVKRLVPICILVAFAFLGAAMFWAVETSGAHMTLFHLNFNNCIGHNGYWGALHFSSTLFTTIGYGNVYPCTTVGRCLTVVYSLMGLPITVYALDVIGKLMLDGLLISYKSVHKRFQSKVDSIEPVLQLVFFEEAHARLTPSEISDVPILFGVVITAAWICGQTIFFSYMEEWPFFESFYFVFISLTTVGLGEFAPANFNWTVANFTFIIVGMSLVSLTINIIERNVENFFLRTKLEIERQYKERMAMGNNEGQDVKAFLKEAQKKAGLLGHFVSSKLEEQLESQINEKNRLVVRGTQTLEAFHSSQITQVCPVICAIGTQSQVDKTTRDTQVSAEIWQMSVATQVFGRKLPPVDYRLESLSAITGSGTSSNDG